MSVDLCDLAHSIPPVTEAGVGFVLPRQNILREYTPGDLEHFGALAVRWLPQTQRKEFASGLVGLMGVELPNLLCDAYPCRTPNYQMAGRWGVTGDTAIWAGEQQEVLATRGPIVTYRARFIGNALLINENKAFAAHLKVAELARRAAVQSGATTLEAIIALLQGNGLEEVEYQACVVYGPQQAEGRVLEAYAGTTLHELTTTA